MDIKIDGFLMDNRCILNKIIAGREGVTLYECRNGLETWFEIHTRHDGNYKSVEILETDNIDLAKKKLYTILKGN